MLSSRTLLRAQKAAGAPRVLTQAVRNYEAPAAVDSKPPVALYGVDGTYASALVCVISLLGAWEEKCGVGEKAMREEVGGSGAGAWRARRGGRDCIL